MDRSGPVRAAAVIAAFLALGTASAAPVGAQVATLRPVDDAARDPSFLDFRSTLLEAVERRDTAHVLSILAEDVIVGFGGAEGVAGFRRVWFAGDRGRERGLWPVLEDVLRAGGTFRSDGTFAAPYVYAAWPDEIDSFQHGAVTGSRVRVRAEPRLGARVLAHLSHAVVRVPAWETTRDRSGEALDWLPVQLRDGRRGWVAARYLASPIDYRAVFVRRDGRWLLRALVAGD